MEYLPDSRRWIVEALPIRMDTPDQSPEVVSTGWVEVGRWSASAWVGVYPPSSGNQAPSPVQAPTRGGVATLGAPAVDPMTRVPLHRRAASPSRPLEPTLALLQSAHMVAPINVQLKCFDGFPN